MKYVFVNGCFDILHRGHFELFEYAKSLGDLLIVAVDSDRRIRAAKGPTRPFFCLSDRMCALNAIKYIDNVYDFDSDEDLENMIKIIKPDIMVVGSDWQHKEIIGSKYAGEVRFFGRIPGYSTTRILENG